jgi:biopolymer transport protein ExbD
MKLRLILTLCLVQMLVPEVRSPADPSGSDSTVLDSFLWDGDIPRIMAEPNIQMEYPMNTSEIRLAYAGNSSRDLLLRVLGPAIVSKIASSHYAVVGKLNYSAVTAGTYLEMDSYFAAQQAGGTEGVYFTRTLADSGPMAKLEGTNDGSDFELPFDATGAKTKLVRLVINLHLAGPGSFDFHDVKLVQYPDSSVPTSAQPERAPQDMVLNVTESGGFSLGGVNYPSLDALKTELGERLRVDRNVRLIIRASTGVPYSLVRQILDACQQIGLSQISFATAPTVPKAPTLAEAGNATAPASSSIAWRSFWLGVATMALSLVALAGGGFLFRRFRRVRHQRELRRIASLDG